MLLNFGEYHDVFVEEADELVLEISHRVNELKHYPGSEGAVDEIIRAVHSLKTGTAFVMFNELSDLLCEMENYLVHLREDKVKIGPDVLNRVEKYFTGVRALYEKVQRNIDDEPDDDEMICFDEETEPGISGKPGVKHRDGSTGLFLMLLEKHILICRHNVLADPDNRMERALKQYLLSLKKSISLEIKHEHSCGIDAIDAVVHLVVSGLNKTTAQHRDYIRWFIDDILSNKLVMAFDRPDEAKEELRLFRESGAGKLKAQPDSDM